jgi:hypothetical protein
LHDDEESAKITPHLDLWTDVANKIKRNISLHSPHGAVSSPKRNDSFVVHYWSSPCFSEENEIDHPSTMWNKPVVCSDSLYGAIQWADAYQLTTPEGQTVGAMDADNLYLYWDAAHSGESSEKEIIAEVCKAVLAIMASPPDKKAKKPKDELIILPVQEEKIVEACSRRLTVAEKAAADEVSRVKSAIDEHLAHLKDKHEAMIRVTTRLSAARSLCEEATTNIKRDIDEIRKLPDLEKYVDRGGVMTFLTKTIKVTHPKTKHKHDLGKFQITIDMNSATIVITNIDHRVCVEKRGDKEKLMHAPYVDQNGVPVWKALNVSLAEWFANCNIIALVTASLNLLKSVCVEDAWGVKLKRWPVVGKESEHVRPLAAKVNIENSFIEFRPIAKPAVTEAVAVAETATEIS